MFEELRKEVTTCKNCELCKTRTNAVFGEGDPATDLVFVGEGPGADEDRSGRPFVGRAGVQLTKIIQNGMNLSRHSVYIANIVKCRPPGNRVPTPSEMAGCIAYLKEQLRTIRPKVIVALGATACLGLLGEKLAITRERGNFREWEGIRVMPTFHPSYLLRLYTPENRRAVWEDMKAVLEYLKQQGSPLVEE
ncbi:MAG: uracil-DNA glycosylase [Planctomycetes bacterium]|nr:uracil-DNA glycosylase [Planctomycetota bacterium]